MTVTEEQAKQVLANANLICSAEQVDLALDSLAKRITSTLASRNPIVLCVMTGGLIGAGRLLTRLQFPLQLDYVHATRYNGGTRGGDIKWLATPSLDMVDRSVLIFDDIYDEGLTLAAIQQYCQKHKAREVFSAVLVEKEHNRSNGIAVDFIGLKVADRYVFGCGMDYHEYFRNLPAIYAVAEK